MSNDAPHPSTPRDHVPLEPDRRLAPKPIIPPENPLPSTPTESSPGQPETRKEENELKRKPFEAR